jgi:hypothetical protein
MTIYIHVYLYICKCIHVQVPSPWGGRAGGQEGGAGFSEFAGMRGVQLIIYDDNYIFLVSACTHFCSVHIFCFDIMVC